MERSGKRKEMGEDGEGERESNRIGRIEEKIAKKEKREEEKGWWNICTSDFVLMQEWPACE